MKDNLMATPPSRPEIDPELADLEANAGKGNFIDRLLRTITRKQSKDKPNQIPNEKSGRDRRHVRGHDRLMRRAMARSGQAPDRTTSPHARLGRAKPVKSPEQVSIEYRRAVKEELSRIKLTRVIRECPEIKFVIGATRIANVWQLSQARSLDTVPGLGLVRRKKIHAYLTSKNVPVVWVP